MTIEDVRKMSDSDLAQKVYELKGELFTLKLQAKAGQLDNGAKITVARKDIARCLTVLQERKIATANAAEGK